MSNATLLDRIRSVIAEFESGRTSFAHLQDVLENTTCALEGLPYAMIVELRGIETRLTIEQSYEEEDCQADIGQALVSLKLWLDRIPANA